MTSRSEIPGRVALILGRPARWASSARCVGDYEGRDRTIEVFNASAGEQLGFVRALRVERPELERVAGGPLVIIFHTPAETDRLYPEMGVSAPVIRYAALAMAFDQWLAEEHPGAPGVNPDQIQRFSFPDVKAA